MTDQFDRLTAALADRYAIERELGAGGMATVYLAEDLKHHRKVAVKVLRPELAAVLGVERFVQEITTTANLQHPHILPLFDSGEADSFLFYVMPFIDGETLRDKLNRETQLGIEEAVKITAEIAGALDHAHKRGVVHRDIKPENILLQDGVALIADFGIAIALQTAGGDRLTETGFSLGTPAYMSPEQAAGGRDVDGRSDLYALACVHYEMLAGDPPFMASNAQALIAKHLTDAAPPITTTRPNVPAAVADAIMKALNKTPADRHETASRFAAALSLGAVVPAVAPDRKSIAVLPFANMSADPENQYFSDGITEDLIAQISKIRDFKVISRTSTMRYKDKDLSLQQVAEELAVATILEGSVRRAGNRVRIVAQLIDARTDEHLWAETYDRELTDVFAIQSDVALEVALALEIALSPAERGLVRTRPTENMEAYDLYLLGRHQANRRNDQGLRRAIGYFEQAIEKDPAFATALAGLADACVLSAIGFQSSPPPDAMERAKRAALEALGLDDALPEAHTALGYYYTMRWDWPRARQEFERAIALNPSYAQAHQWYHHCLIGLRDFRSALEEATRARELDPLSVVLTNELGWPYLYMGEFQRAREQFLRALEMDPDFAMAHFNLASTFECEGRYDEAVPIYEKAVELSGRMPFITACLGGAYVRSNRVDEARAIRQELFELAETVPGMLLWVAYLHEAFGETEEALECLERACVARAPMLQVIGTVWLRFESVRDHPRFAALLGKIGVSGGFRSIEQHS